MVSIDIIVLERISKCGQFMCMKNIYFTNVKNNSIIDREKELALFLFLFSLDKNESKFYKAYNIHL